MKRNVSPRNVGAKRAQMHQDPELKRLSRDWFDKSYKYRYSYNFK